jgi:hypothetical protein
MWLAEQVQALVVSYHVQDGQVVFTLVGRSRGLAAVLRECYYHESSHIAALDMLPDTPFAHVSIQVKLAIRLARAEAEPEPEQWAGDQKKWQFLSHLMTQKTEISHRLLAEV